MKSILLIYFSLLIIQLNAQVIINGFSDLPTTTIEVFEIEDYITKTEKKIVEAKVDEKGRFRLIFSCKEIKKIIIRLNKNYSWMYVQPNITYFIEIPKDGQVTNFELNNETEMLFFNLDSNDINYKILGFEAWMDEYLSDIYILKDLKPAEFTEKIKLFKKEVNDVYNVDTSSYFKNYLKYSIGINIDNLNFYSAPSKEEKFIFYIKNNQILNNHDKYMEYFYLFYKNYYYQLDKITQEQLYIFIINQDLENCIITLLKDAHISDREYAELLLLILINDKKIDSENSRYFLNSISKNSNFRGNQLIAENILKKGNKMIIGELFPELELEKNKTLEMLKGKPIYLHFFDPKNQKSIAEIIALKNLNEKYAKYIKIISIYSKASIPFKSSELQNINLITWEKYELDPNGNAWKFLNISTFPYYILLDKDLILLASPALSPSPNATYKTIEKTFFDFKINATKNRE